MSDSEVQFGAFKLDSAERRLSRRGETVELNARYMDALILLVEASGDLVAKDRFMEEVWRGVPVTDEALTQAIRTLRRTLGDSASAPRFIETVPKYGYRFIAPVEATTEDTRQAVSTIETPRASFIRTALAGTGGAILAGALIGLLYGFVGTAQVPMAGGGAVSLLLVLMLVSILSASVAGAGISAGLAASQFIRPPRWYWTTAGGALGGVTIGAFANLLGKDAFSLLFGQTVERFAGAFEGLILGGVMGLAFFLVSRGLKPACGIAALLGLGAGLMIALFDGRMMAGSLQSLVSSFPSSRFHLEWVGSVLGEEGLGPIGRMVTAALEGAIFSAGIIWALGRTAGPMPPAVTRCRR